MAFHVELRQFPATARAFNLSEEQLRRQILDPWLQDNEVELQGHRFSPAKARLQVYEGRSLAPEEIGLGRGWSNVTRLAQEVTGRELDRLRAAGEASSIEPFKRLVLTELAASGRAPAEILGLAGEQYPQARVSDRLALAERAVWELLHRGQVALTEDGEPVDRARWEPLLLDWRTWTEAEPLRLEATGSPAS